MERIGNDCETKYFKFLGLLLDETLSWDHHRSHVARKVATGAYMLCRLKRIVPLKIRMLIYNGLIRPHYEYMLEVWGASPASKLKVFKLNQKKCLRNILCTNYRAHTDPLFAQLGVMKFEDMVVYATALLAHRVFYSEAPPSIVSLWKRVEPEFNRSLSFKLSPGCHRFTMFPQYRVSKVWNLLDLEIKSIVKYSTFKLDLFKSFIQKYESHVTCENEFCTECN